ncbi:MAG TPA: nucleoside hydrolase-like domain-containing protein [Luteitalea sp.]|nr:nucleoside hydrolase-like domain-containing protein [Luteitalea sp.]
MSLSVRGPAAVCLAIVTATSSAAFAQPPRQPQPVPPLAARVDPHVERVRMVILTDIANEPDDQMSLVRFLVYANHFDVEGLIATTSTWLRDKVRPDVLKEVLGAYTQVQPLLAKHAAGFPTADALRAAIASGQPGYGMAAVGDGKASEGSAMLLKAMMRDDPRPLWVTAWGGTNTLAQALVDARRTLTPDALRAAVAKLRVYTISDQDDAGPWLRREFPDLHYVAMPSTQDGQEYAAATWTGISGDLFYRNAPGADFSTFTDAWLDTNIRARGPLGKFYPYPCCIHEGDTPAFLGLIDNGLASAMNPTYGGWGGRYIWRQPHGEPRAFWTQGGDSYPGRDSSRDTVVGKDGVAYTSDHATIWRWRTAFQHDFAARMAWTVLPPERANHNPRLVVNGASGTAPIEVETALEAPVVLDAAGTTDPDGQALRYKWWVYEEAGTGIPGQPVVTPGPRPATAGPQSEATVKESPPAARGVRPAPRVTIAGDTTARATVTPRVRGVTHIILEVSDGGEPSLTSYRRVIVRVK